MAFGLPAKTSNLPNKRYASIIPRISFIPIEMYLYTPTPMLTSLRANCYIKPQTHPERYFTINPHAADTDNSNISMLDAEITQWVQTNLFLRAGQN